MLYAGFMKKKMSSSNQWQYITDEGETLNFENCKGGYFSSREEYGLKLIGKTLQDGTPKPNNPVEIQCVKAGTKIICGNEVTLPCDLYEGDIWYPASGKVVKCNNIVTVTKVLNIIRREDNLMRFVVINPVKTGSRAYSNRFRPGYSQPPGIYVGTNNHADLFVSYDMIGCTTDNTNSELITAMNTWFAENQTEIVYELAEPILEEYEPQRLWMPNGTVNVMQEPIDLTGTLSASVLVKKG